jgi:PhnB protein
LEWIKAEPKFSIELIIFTCLSHSKTMTQAESNSIIPDSRLKSSLTPWLSVGNCVNAVKFYQAAFSALEVYRMEADGGLVVRLSVDGAEFCVSGDSSDLGNPGPESLGGGSVRMILTVGDPDAVFAQALSAGATQVFPVGEEYGWRLGRLMDPFGLHWEIGRPVV